jgi:hypothetical protein
MQLTKEGVRRLVTDINDIRDGSVRLPAAIMQETFAKWWPQLQEMIEQACTKWSDVASPDEQTRSVL